MDPVSRLSRPIPGQHLGWIDPRLDRVLDRDVVSERRGAVAKLEKALDLVAPEWKVRPPARLGEPKPNAPQLIRLVRYPFAITGVKPQRTAVREARVVRAERTPETNPLRQPEFRATLEKLERVTSHRPKLEPRPRPSAELWTLTR